MVFPMPTIAITTAIVRTRHDEQHGVEELAVEDGVLRHRRRSESSLE